MLAFTVGVLLGIGAATSAHAQNIIVPEMQFRLDTDFIEPLNAVLPPLPDSVPTSRGWSRVRVVRIAMCSIKSLPVGVALDGCVDYVTRVIEVATGESLAEQWHTLKHEMAHLMFKDTGIRFSTPQLEERACDVVATWALMEYLKQPLAPGVR